MLKHPPAIPQDIQAPEESEIHVGLRLRELRTSRGLSLRALAEKSGLNINTLSMVENQHTSPSVSTLQQLAQAMQIPISAFFDNTREKKQVVYQKKGARPHVTFSHGVIEDLGAGMPHFVVEPLIVTLEPHADSGSTPIVHTGREFIYCLEGQITYTVGIASYELDPGDSLLFDAYLPHQWKNSGEIPSRNLLVLCPTDERDHPADRHFTI
jgi:transcriptional regulator with XRE-family HTH domain